MADCSMATSRLRMLVKEGLLWGLGLQHSEDQKTSEHLLYGEFNPQLWFHSK